jgi:hypothetical protein
VRYAAAGQVRQAGMQRDSAEPGRRHRLRSLGASPEVAQVFVGLAVHAELPGRALTQDATMWRRRPSARATGHILAGSGARSCPGNHLGATGSRRIHVITARGRSLPMLLPSRWTTPLSHADNPGMSAQRTDGDERSWTMCPHLRRRSARSIALQPLVQPRQAARVGDERRSPTRQAGQGHGKTPADSPRDPCKARVNKGREMVRAPVDVVVTPAFSHLAPVGVRVTWRCR